MYFIYKYITNATTTAINACNFFYLTLVKGRQLFLFTLPNKGEYSIFSQRKQIFKEMRKRGKHRKRCKILLL